MNKTETITPKDLKKIMKLSIAIDVELGFYMEWHQKTITIDKNNNWDSSKTAMYNINAEDRDAIFILINAYARLHMKSLRPAKRFKRA